MRIKIKNKLFLQDIPPSLAKTIKGRLTLANPKYLENERMGRWNGEIPEYLKFYEREGNSLIVPRGYVRPLINLCWQNNVQYQLDDQRRTLPEVSFSFNGKLRPFQEEAVEAMLEKDFGALSAPTGSGKTIMALYIITQRKQPAIIVVHTKELLNQWIDRIETFLKIPRGDQPSTVLTGDVPAKERQDIVDRLNSGKVKVLVATGQLIGEGFDCKGLSTLFLGTPISFDGRITQYLGRVLRPAPGKDKATVFDYIDIHVPVLVASAKVRQRVYEV